MSGKPRAAALRPSQSVWNSFLDKLRKLEESSTISSQEYLAIVASRLIDSRLAEFEDDAGMNVQTVADVVAQVKADYSKEWERVVEEAKSITQRHAEERTLAEQQARKSEEERRQFELKVYGRINAAASVLAGGIFYLAAGLAILGFILSIPGILPNFPKWLKGIAQVDLLIVGGLSVINLVWGKSVMDHRQNIKVWLSQRFRYWLTGR